MCLIGIGGKHVRDYDNFNDKFDDFQTILSGELLWKIIVKIKMHSSMTKMTSTRWITAVGILKPLGRWVWRYQRGNQNRILKKSKQHNGQKKKYKRWNNDQQSIHIYKTGWSNTNPTKNRGWTQMIRKGKQFLLH